MPVHHLQNLTDPDAAATTHHHAGPNAETATAQAHSVFDLLETTLAAHNCQKTDICKLTLRITDRAWREPVYAVLGQRLPGVFPVSTGLIVHHLDDPHALFQLDVHAVPGGPHRRLRPYRSSDGAYGLQKQAFSMDFCMTVQAGPHILLRGQTGSTLDRRFPHLDDAPAQIRQAIANIEQLLSEAGATRADTTHLVTYATHPALFDPLRTLVTSAFPHLAPTEQQVAGLAAPELLIEIDVIAYRPTS